MVRRLPIIALFLLVAIALLVGIHSYLLDRLVLEPGVPEPWRGLLIGFVVALAASVFLAPIAERLLEPRFSRLVSWPASVWMGFAFLLLTLLAASDLLLWAGAGAALAASDGPGETSRVSGLRAAAVASLALVAGMLGLRSGLGPPQHRRVDVEIGRWPRALDGFRIVQISDLHIGSILGRRFAAHVVSRVNALAPDLVAVTGDLVDGSVRRLFDEVAPFAGLRGRHGVFFVTGNHDHYSGAASWVAKIRELGIHVLRNERVAIGDGEAVFDLVGVDDHRGDMLAARGGEDLPRALEGREPSRPAVLLAHDPSTFKRASGMGIDLQLSGHTHGGQIWPFRHLVRLVVPQVAGHYRKGDAQLYVSCGTGFWGPPMRLFAPAEITEIVLRRPGGGSEEERAN